MRLFAASFLVLAALLAAAGHWLLRDDTLRHVMAIRGEPQESPREPDFGHPADPFPAPATATPPIVEVEAVPESAPNPPDSPPTPPDPAPAPQAATLSIRTTATSVLIEGALHSETYRDALIRGIRHPGLEVEDRVQIGESVTEPPWASALLDSLPVLLAGAGNAELSIQAETFRLQRPVKDELTRTRLLRRLESLFPPGWDIDAAFELPTLEPAGFAIRRRGDTIELSGAVDRNLAEALRRTLGRISGTTLDDQLTTPPRTGSLAWSGGLKRFLEAFFREVDSAAIRLDARTWELDGRVPQDSLKQRWLDEATALLPAEMSFVDRLEVAPPPTATLKLTAQSGVITLRGAAPSHRLRTHWADAARFEGRFLTAVFIDVDPALASPPWSDALPAMLEPILLRTGEAVLDLQPEQATLVLPPLPDESRDSLEARLLERSPPGYRLEIRFEGERPPAFALDVHLTGTEIHLDGAVPSRRFRDDLLAPLLEMERFTALHDDLQVQPGLQSPPWLDRLPGALAEAASMSTDVRLIARPQGIELDGRAPTLASRLNFTRLIRSTFPNLTSVKNRMAIEVAPVVEPDPEALLAATSNLSSPTPEPPPLASIPKPESPLEPPSSSPTPARFRFALAENSVELNALLPPGDLAGRLRMAIQKHFPATPFVDALETARNDLDAPWMEALPGLVAQASQHLNAGEIHLEGGKALLRGQAASAEARDSLIAAVAQTLPPSYQLEDEALTVESLNPGFRRSVFFNTGSTYIGLKYRRDINEAVAEWKRRPQGATMLVKGYADPRGDAEMNRILSQQRAEEVRKYLLSQGVPAPRIKILEMSAPEPAPSTAGESWQNDRRVDLSIGN